MAKLDLRKEGGRWTLKEIIGKRATSFLVRLATFGWRSLVYFHFPKGGEHLFQGPVCLPHLVCHVPLHVVHFCDIERFSDAQTDHRINKRCGGGKKAGRLRIFRGCPPRKIQTETRLLEEKVWKSIKSIKPNK